MARVGRGDDNSLHLGRGNQLLAGLVGGNAVVLRCDLDGGLLEVVCAGNDLTARHEVGQTADMIAADSAAADNTNIKHKMISFCILCGYLELRSRAAAGFSVCVNHTLRRRKGQYLPRNIVILPKKRGWFCGRMKGKISRKNIVRLCVVREKS